MRQPKPPVLDITRTPYVMTAHHCGIRSYNVAALVVYWNCET